MWMFFIIAIFKHEREKRKDDFLWKVFFCLLRLAKERIFTRKMINDWRCLFPVLLLLPCRRWNIRRPTSRRPPPPPLVFPCRWRDWRDLKMVMATTTVATPRPNRQAPATQPGPPLPPTPPAAVVASRQSSWLVGGRRSSESRKARSGPPAVPSRRKRACTVSRSPEASCK